jgi:ACR3 family arsenite efflux pump ArsB
VLATIIVIGTSVGAAIFTYIGLSNPKELPNGIAVITAVIYLVVPLAITYFSRVFANTGRNYESVPPEE